jgi:hypothetical protein
MQEGEGSVYTRVTGEAGRMGPLKNIGANRIRNKQSTSRTGQAGGNNAGGWHNGIWLRTSVAGGELTGEGVRLGIPRTGAMSVKFNLPKNKAHLACREFRCLAVWM